MKRLGSIPIGICVLGEQNTLFAFAAAVYPTPIRSTGASTAMGVGRIGSIVGPMIGSVLISLGWPSSVLFYVSALPTLCGLFIVLAMVQVRSHQQAVPAVGEVPIH